jgi:hypothetical protein
LGIEPRIDEQGWLIFELVVGTVGGVEDEEKSTGGLSQEGQGMAPGTLVKGFHVYHGANVLWWLAFFSGWVDPFSIFGSGEVFLMMLPVCGLMYIGGCWKASSVKSRWYAFASILFWWLVYGYFWMVASAAV